MSVWTLLCGVFVLLLLTSICVFPVWETTNVEICLWGQPSDPASVWGMCDGVRSEDGRLVFPGSLRSIEIKVATDSIDFFFDLNLSRFLAISITKT